MKGNRIRLKQKKIVMAALVVGLMLCTTGCSSGEKHIKNPDAKYFSVNIDGERIEIAEDDERIVTLYDLAQNFIPAAMDRDYRNPDVETEYNYYSSEYTKTLKESGRKEKLLESMKTYESIFKVESVDVTKIQIYRFKGQDAASITADYIQRYEHAVDGYLESLGVKENGRYQRTMTINLINEDGRWGIYDYSSSSRVEVK